MTGRSVSQDKQAASLANSRLLTRAVLYRHLKINMMSM